ncbi:holo-ACP synthase [Shewanella sp. NIFS-20-20]|uniref:holo-ACP synthase n=1 Tax=Shewanella sp. NIFS-20-20 TaxID=2853806 RepID=UPI001C479165|nr:holo-ACP synthase [Shewanella sp. NIFS-20-20]MBV7314225.1 holo-ACP synthase [Shewanella sp. NIFS-20-20]
MAIIGLGSDIVEIARLESQVARIGDKLAQRVLTPTEMLIFHASNQPARFLAKRFAAKEAAAKALGTGIGRGVSFQHFHISNDEWGAPQLTLTDGALARLQQLGGQRAWITIADERHYAVATVVLESSD